MLIIGAVVCSAAVVVLSCVAIFYWKYPSFRDQAFPLILFLDLVFAYRLYRYLKMIKGSSSGQKYGVTPLS
jgi:hypothetical protein